MVRDVSALGRSNEGGGKLNDFAMPSGNIWCAIAVDRASCWVNEYDAGAEPKDSAGQYFVGVGAFGASWGIGNGAGGKPDLDGYFPEGRAWWDAQFGSKLRLPNSSTDLAVLPYGKSLVAGDFQCTSTTKGAQCENTATGHGFLISRTGGTLH